LECDLLASLGLDSSLLLLCPPLLSLFLAQPTAKLVVRWEVLVRG
jgi:hypothetical protein